MNWKGILATKPFISQFLILVGLCSMSMGIFSLLGFVLASVIYHVDSFSNPAILSQLDAPGVVDALKLIQTFSAIGLFIFPAWLASWLFSKDPADFLSLKKRPKINAILLTVVILFATVPMINWLVTLNQQMALPSFLAGIEQWMKDSEDQAAKLTEAFLKTGTVAGLITNLLIIALIPAIGEELLFRGVLQRLFSDAFKNKHLAIFISAALFSALHMQFYGFIPRMLLGALFGYFLVWSNTLWLPIIGHFVNNASAVIFSFYAAKTGLPFNQDTIGTQPGDEVVLITTVLLSVSMMWLLYKIYEKPKVDIVIEE